MLLPIKIPPSLHKKVALYAAREGVDLDTFVSSAIAEHLARPVYLTPMSVAQLTPEGLVRHKAKQTAKKPGRKAKKKYEK